MQMEKELVKYKIDLAALQEIRWPGVDKFEQDKGIIFYSGRNDGRHEEGVGFYLNKRLGSAVKEFESISSRIARIRLETRWFNLSVLSVHAPTEVSDENVKDRWYEELQLVLDRIPGHDMLIILGDMNAQIGRETAAFHGSIGRHSLHETCNDNGIRMATLATAYGLVVGGTLFPHKDKHKGTWISPDGNTINQIDHVMVKRRFRSALTDVRVFRGADCDSDHFMLGVKIRIKLKVMKTRMTRREVFNCEKLQNEEEKIQYQLVVENKFSALENMEDMDEVRWSGLKDIMTQAARETIGTITNRRREKWFNGECERAAKRRNKLRMEWLGNRERVDKRRYFVEARAEACRINRRCKRGALNRDLCEIERNTQAGRTRAQFQGIKWIRRGYQPRLGLIKNKNGEYLTNEEQIKMRWKEHFEELLNRPEPQHPVTEEAGFLPPDINEPTPTQEEILWAIRSMKNNKAAGIDDIHAEFIKYGGRRFHQEIIKLVKQIWTNEVMPQDWEEGIFVTIHKKGDRTDCTNYRGICLLSVGYKIFVKVLYKRLNAHCENILGDYQAGFRRNKSTINHIFTHRQILKKYGEYNKESWHVFIDFKQAYDSIHRDSLWNIMRGFEIPEKIIRLVQMCYTNTKCRVRVGGELTEPFEVVGGLKQGCALSTLLFNLALEWVMRRVPEREGIQVGEVTCDRMAYADDVDLMSENLGTLSEMVGNFVDAAERVGLGINQSKTKVMKASRDGPELENIRCGGLELEGVEDFKYLGSTVNSQNEIAEEVKTRIAAAARCSWAINQVFKSNVVSRRTKIQTYTTLIRPVLTYGSETWSMTKQLERRLEVFENGVLRRICGPVWDAYLNIWRRRHNRELRDLTQLPPITSFIRAQRLRWAGHVARMPVDCVVGGIARGVPNGRRPVGRPRHRWEDNIKKDLAMMGVEDLDEWWNRAENREEWRLLVMAAMDHMGPQPAD